MNSSTSRSRAVGVLFIVATVASALGVVLLGSILEDPGYLTDAAADEVQVSFAVLLDLIAAASIAAIAVMIFPVLKRQSETSALGYLAARIIEATIIVVGAIGLLSILSLSQEYVQAGGPDPAGFRPLGPVLLELRDWTDLIATQFVFGLTALILNYALYQARLVPRWLSVWGLIGAVLAIAAGVMGIFGQDPFSTFSVLLFLPIAVNEMVLAVWLIVKGFNPATSASHT